MKLTAFAGTALVAAAIFIVPSGARAQTLPTGREPASLRVAGDATVRHEPDQARADVDILTSDDDAARSAGKNSDIVNALRAKLAPLGVTGDAIGTTSFNVSFVPRPPRNLPPEQRQPRYGYITTRSLAITVAPIDRIGRVVDAATAAGVTDIADVSFELKDRKALYRQALAAALVDARATGTALAGTGELRIVRVLHVDAGGGPGGPIRPYRFARSAALSATVAPTPTEIAPNGPIEVSAHVDVTYEIADR